MKIREDMKALLNAIDSAEVTRALHRTCAVVVLFHPEQDSLARLLRMLTTMLGGVVLVDNTPGAIEMAPESGGDNGAVWLRNGRNVGLAAAQNRGIEWARGQGFGYILLLDQDSEPHAGMCVALAGASLDMEARGVIHAAVGPRYIDPRTGHSSFFVQIGPFGFRRIRCSGGTGVIPADFLISSGSLIRVTVFERVGLMDEGLFIDHIDTDWYLRCRRCGLRAYGVCDAVMHHRLGDDQLRLWWGRYMYVPRYTPLRTYYMFRNSLLLYRRPHAPPRWIAADIVRLGKVLFVRMLFGPDRLQHLKMLLRALADGLRGRTGQVACAG